MMGGVNSACAETKFTRATRPCAQPSQLTDDPVADVHLRQDRLRHEEAHPDVLRRQQRHDRPAGLHHLADTEIDFLHAAGDRAHHAAPVEPRARRVEPRLGGAQGGFRVVEHLLRADRPLEQLLGAVVGHLGIGDGGLVLRHGRALQLGVEREQRRAYRDRIALAHGQRLHAPRLVGAHEDEVGLDPAFELALRRSVADIGVGGEGDACRHRDRGKRKEAHLGGFHGAPFRILPVSTSRCASRRPRTSRGSMLAKSPSQRTATSSGATMSWG